MYGRTLTVILVALALALPATASAQTAEPEQAYLGVHIAPVPRPLASQLGLEPHEGLLVTEVVPGSPAAKAGVEQDDVLVEVDAVPVQGGEQLVRVVQRAGVGADLRIELIHRGSSKAIVATLETRPKVEPHAWLPSPEPLDPWTSMDKMVEEQEKLFDGMKIPLDSAKATKSQVYVERMSTKTDNGSEMWDVRIDGDPSNPSSHVTIERGNDKWEISVKKVDELPKDVRAVAKDAIDHAQRDAVQPSFEDLSPFPNGSGWDQRFERRM